jgi:hypothetical protein
MQRKVRRLAFLAAIASFAALGTELACSDSPDTTTGGGAGEPSVESALLTSCKVTSSTCTKPAPHYGDIAPILDRSCNSCHTGIGHAPWALTDYEHVSAWAEAIQQDLSMCTMPPLDGGVAMTAADRLEVLDWVQCGAPQ